MMVEEFRIGDPVWAKMKGYPPWPAKVISPPPDAKAPKNKHFVYFFGSNNSAWIPNDHISPHNEQQLLNSVSKKRTATLQNAVDDLLIYSKSYKRKKPSSPKMKSEQNKDKKPRSKIAKVINNVSKRHEKSVFADKSCIKGKKRSFEDLNRNATYPSSKSSSSNFKDKNQVISTVPRPVPLYPSFLSNDSATDRFTKNPKRIQPSNLRFGFIGLGVMGKNIVKTLIQSGHDITVWNRTSQHCDMFLIMGAKRARSPADLILNCDVTFCCVSDPEATKAIIFGEQGVLMGLVEASKLGKGRRGFVNMTNTDPDTSIGIGEAVTLKRGFYLEAPVCGTSLDAASGTLLVLAAGDRILFSECETCFHAIGKHAYFLSCDAGEGNKMNLVLSTLSGTLCAALAEVMVLVERLKLQKEDFLQCLAYGTMYCPAIYEKAKMMANLSFKRVTALKHVQKDMDLSLMMANAISQRMPVTVAANETYKCAKMRKISEEDVSAVYKVVRF